MFAGELFDEARASNDEKARKYDESKNRTVLMLTT